MEGFEVRPLGEGDVEEILRLEEGNPLYFRHCPPWPGREGVLADCRALPPGKGAEDKYYVGYFRGERLSAILDLILRYPGEKTAFVGLFMVDRAEQGKGLGSRLVEEMARRLWKAGFETIRLAYARGNGQSRAFWRKNGFRETGEEVPVRGYTAVLMERQLDRESLPGGGEGGTGEKGRFAPSPSGRMHLGNAFSALLSWLSVRSVGGQMVLRMEDLDPDRCREAYARALADDLRWLGLTWDEGYEMGGEAGPYSQSRRTEIYARAFGRLEEKGLVYPCYCTRAERLASGAPHGSDGQRVYDGKCFHLTEKERQALESAGRSPAWRLRVPEGEVGFADGHMGAYREDLARDCGDFILRRSDGVYAYQLAVVVDDAAMGVTQVVRGRDLLSSTPRQQYLFSLLGERSPSYSHVPLLLSPEGRRLSKRDGDLDMGALRKGHTPQEVLGVLGFLAGQLEKPCPVSAGELAERFDWAKVPREDIVVDASALFRG